jgi:GTP-binding protein
VGKSTLLNAVLGRKLAKVSGSPGKTRLLNVFQVPLGRGEWGVGPAPERKAPLPTPSAFYLLDLPGYGYARVSQTERAAFHRLLERVLHRPRLVGAVWLLDLRREPSADDQAMQDLLAAGHVPVLAAFTKADKLPRGQQRDRARALRAALHLDDEQTVSTSATTGDGIPELRQAIGELVTKATAAG